MVVLGIDIGGSGIKGAPVDLVTGLFTSDRVRIETPQPADTAAVVQTVVQVAGAFEAAASIGITFPAVVQHGVTKTAANVDKSWVDAPAEQLFSAALGKPVTVLNDADAAGVAEVEYGAGRGVPGLVVMVTFGTGIGTALFIDGTLVPNTEFGHLQMSGLHLHGGDAEDYASDRVREADDLGWPEFAERVQTYLRHLHALLWPDLIIVGGGVSKKAEKWLHLVDVPTKVVPAALQNNAGIAGAALLAARNARVV
ncbi:ROK family protein [Dactylosporangium vinaceum]|uniref:Polyphosphate--glucose phosphotransferase n=1 Tax=Dactylosporangium vinaceum TaxID=53362 RepID=A0ABV5MCJ7_9ACTN|nr:ROK family protein [Dactylosporangium vinaceum]UAB92197.1 ROK family protein [Dactylosporangium vinaceum]